MVNPPFVVGIPSFRRGGRQKTLEFLERCGLGKDRLFISVQTEADRDEYASRYGARANVVYRAADSVGGNRNTVIEACARHSGNILLLDDDISAITVLVKKGEGRCGTLRDLSCAEVVPTLEWMFGKAHACHAQVFGLYPMPNAMFQSTKVTADALVIGTVFGITNSSLRFNPAFRVKEDYELCCREIRAGRPVLRFDAFSVRASHKTKGGCDCDWHNGASSAFGKRLVAMYPDIVKENPTRPGEVLRRR